MRHGSRCLVLSLSHAAGFSQWFGNQDVVSMVPVKKIIPSRACHCEAPAAATRAGAGLKAGVFALAVTGFRHVEFTVLIRRNTGMFSGRHAGFSGNAGHPDHSGRGASSTILNPVLIAYEESLQKSGCPAAAAHSRPHPPDGKGPRRPAVSRRISPATADAPGMAHSGAGFGAQARTRRLLNGECNSLRPRLHCFNKPQDRNESKFRRP